MLTRTFAIVLALVSIGASSQAPATIQGHTYISPGGIRLRLMLDDANIGPNISVGEMTFPPNVDSGDHRHGATEIFYVLSGTLEHIVNGKSETLTAGMTGYVKPPDTVRHKTGPDGAKTVVIWTPGDEAQKIVARWQRDEAPDGSQAVSAAFQARIAMMSLARVHAVTGERDKAYEWLNKLADAHPAPTFLGLVSSAKEFASLKDEPRFTQVLERLKPCNSPEYHQFDFWVGSWDVQNPQAQSVGHNDITRIVGGCILQENWTSSRVAQSGTSFNFYDFRDKKWHQDYYDNSGNMGNYPPLTGELRDGRMVLRSAPGVQPLSRWTWYELAPGKVRQMAEQSTDDGKTWSITWDSIYVKK